MSTMVTGANDSGVLCSCAYVCFSDLKAIYDAITEARKEKSKPTLIRLRTTIGYGSKQQGTHGVHGARQ
jgi:transketolase